jgi:hypothetical protein
MRWLVLSKMSIYELEEYYKNIEFDDSERAIFTPDFYLFYVRQKGASYFKNLFRDLYGRSARFYLQIFLYGFTEISDPNIRHDLLQIILDLKYEKLSQFFLDWLQRDLIDVKFLTGQDLILYAIRDVKYSGKYAEDLFNSKKAFNPERFSDYINEYYRKDLTGIQKVLFKILISYGINNNLTWNRDEDYVLERFNDVDKELLKLKRDFEITISQEVLLDIEILKANNNLRDLRLNFQSLSYNRYTMDIATYFIQNNGIGRFNTGTFYRYVFENINNYSGLELERIVKVISPLGFMENEYLYKNVKTLSETPGMAFLDIDKFIEHCEERVDYYHKRKDPLYFTYNEALEVFRGMKKRLKL